MLSVPVFNMQGQRTGDMAVDPAALGGRVRPSLIKQAVDAYLDHQRQRSARTKGRSQVEGSTRKLFRQKGTGNARMGQIRTPIRRGGGRAFAKRIPGAEKDFPKQMRRLAKGNALLARIKGGDVVVVEGLKCDGPRTKPIAAMLKALGVNRTCMIALHERDRNIYLSGRNIAGTEVRLAGEMNAYEVLRPRKLVFTKEALEGLLAPSAVSVASAD